MSGTAWISDRIPAKTRQAAPPAAKGKQQKRGGQDAPAKSQEVRRLEKLRNDLEKASGQEKDPKGGCFCQARMHDLSAYTPLCRACGLVLCELNLPHHACPHCAAALLAPPARAALTTTLTERIDATLAREEEERQRAIDAARAAQGAFPTLASAGASRAGTPDAHPANQTHTVLSLDAKTRKVKVASYTPPTLSRVSSAEKLRAKAAAEQEYRRVPAPPPEVVVAAGLPRADRPWANTRGLNVTYVPPTRVG